MDEQEQANEEPRAHEHGGDAPSEAPATPEPKPSRASTKRKAKRKKRKKSTKKKAKKREDAPRLVSDMRKPASSDSDLKLVAVAIIALVILAASIMVIKGAGKGQDKVIQVTTTTVPGQGGPQTADEYDIVTVDYVGSYLNGTVFDTSIREIAEVHNIVNPLRTYEPITFTLGYGGVIEGFDEALTGMRVGDEKEVVIPPEKAYGHPRSDLLQTVERVQSSPIVQNVSMQRFRDEIGLEPFEGLMFNVPNRSAYELTWDMEVLSVDEDADLVRFRYHPAEDTTIDTVFGPALVSGTEDTILIELQAQPGESIVTLAGPAVVTDVNEENITLDFNHALAGHTLKFQITLTGIVKQ